MYYGYSIISGREKSSYIRGGEYTGINSPAETISTATGNFNVIRTNSERNRILEIDSLLASVNEEYISLSRSVITASDVVKEYVNLRINELRDNLEALETERRTLISAVS